MEKILENDHLKVRKRGENGFHGSAVVRMGVGWNWSGSCPVASFGIISVDNSNFVPKVLII
jgi:hypothetical protein